MSGEFDSGIEVLPGEHTVMAQMYHLSSMGVGRNPTWKSTLKFNAEAGKVYIVNGQRGGPTDWRIWVYEASTGESIVGNAPPAHITGDKNSSPPLPFTNSVWIYPDKGDWFSKVTSTDVKRGTLTINSSANELDIRELKFPNFTESIMLLKIPRGSMLKVTVGDLSSHVYGLPHVMQFSFISLNQG